VLVVVRERPVEVALSPCCAVGTSVRGLQ
jgi:hypothetical protein